MNFEKQRFAAGVDRDIYNRLNPPSGELANYQITAIKSVSSLMEFFTHIEEGLARTIVTGTGLDVPGRPDLWKPIVNKIGKCFSTEQQIAMVEDLVEVGKTLEILEPSVVTMPNCFNVREMPYFKACRLAMQYRNELAHNWFIFLISKRGEHYLHTPMLGLDNPRSENSDDVFTALDLSSSDFINWVYRISIRLPVFIGTPIVQPIDSAISTINAKDYFSRHKISIIRQIEKSKVSKEKSITKLIESLAN